MSEEIADLIAAGCLRLEYLETDRWEYNAVTDARCCDACLELDGVIFTSAQIRQIFPYAIFNPLLIYPMVHPHCRCAMVLLEEPPAAVPMPPAVVVPGKGQKPAVHIENPLTQSEIDRVMRAISLDLDYDIGQPKGLGESFLDKRKKKIK